jgi:copper(I)-binding protein
MEMFRHWIVLLAAGLAGAAQAQVEVRDAWVRGMVETQKATGAFMRITSQSPARLVGAQTPVAGVVEIHQTTMEGGVMRMRPVEAIELPAGKAVELKPGGYHVMLMQVPRVLKEGETVPLTLEVEGKDGKRQTIEVNARVRPLAAGKRGTAHKQH